ncbi:endo-1,4-beta-xylanase [Flindersiella endophytica]
MHRKVISPLAGFGLLLGCLAAAVVTATPAAAALRDGASARNFQIGTAVATAQLSNEAQYRTLAGQEFNLVVGENAMKWDATEPNQNQFNFGGADQIMAFAQANNQAVHGHTLVWHNQTPGWVQGLSATAMRSAMQNHINTVVGRYAGRIATWDVVNEVFNEDGSLRQSFWLNTMGQSYIADAFRFARAADPNAKLCINDYNVEGVNAKSTGMFNLVSSLRSQGVPIDCVGFQGHLSIQFGFPNDLQQNLQRFANLGVDVRISELDVRMQTPSDSTKLATQATYYGNVFRACLAVTRCTGVTIWGFTDKYSWVPGTFPGEGAALPWNENYQQKPAYATINTALGGGNTTDTTPPSTPGTPTASSITGSTANLTWGASTDTGGSGLAGYNVYREQGTTDPQLASAATNSIQLTGLTANTQYQVYVRARDGAGNLSGNSALVTFTTQSGGTTGTCRITYSANNWGGNNGFTGTVTIANTGTTAINGWTLAFTFPSGQRITDSWAATWTQPSGSANVTATNLSWNGTINPGNTTSIGFNATHTGTNTNPTAFTLNGTTCTTQ